MQIVQRFLSKRWDQKSPLLLGYSGGPDSRALLLLLREMHIPFHIAHVDHAWREESGREAEVIRQEAFAMEIPFHMTRLTCTDTSNREAHARMGRLEFFRALFETGQYQALLLGHQADDVAETVIKRLFEGAHLAFMGGMESEGVCEGIAIWRPLLKVRREQILDYLREKRESFLEDPSNRDPAYLRSRMRLSLFPLLNESFGKQVVRNLAHLSERAVELRQYLDRRIATASRREGSWGFAVCCRGLERIEARHLLQDAMRGLPRTILEPLLDWIGEKKDHRKIFFQSRWIVLYRGWVLFLNATSGKALPEKEQVRKLVIFFDATSS